MSMRKLYDIDDFQEPVMNILESIKLFKSEKKEIKANLKQVETNFIAVWDSVHSKTPPSKKRKLINITDFRICTELVSTCPESKYKTLETLQNILFKVYLSSNWNPTLLQKLFIVYYKYFVSCWKFVVKRRSTISELLQLTSVSANSESLSNLMKIINKSLWKETIDTDRTLKRRNKPRNLDDDAL